MTPLFIARQLSRPTGLLGRVIGFLMNRRNAALNEFAVGRLELLPSDRVLEIGFGGGVALPYLLDAAALVVGFDRSKDVVFRANARFAEAVAAGRAHFQEGSVEALPFGVGSFQKVCTVNTVYFWSSLDPAFREIHRVLSTGGRLVVGFHPKASMDRMGLPAEIFTTRTADEVGSALARVGFHDVRVERPQPTTAWNVIVATR